MDKSNTGKDLTERLKVICPHKRYTRRGDEISTLEPIDVEDNMLVCKCTICGGIKKHRLFTAKEVDEMLTAFNNEATYNWYINGNPSAFRRALRTDLKIIEAYEGMMNVANNSELIKSN